MVGFGFDHFCEGYFHCQNKMLYGLNLMLTSLTDMCRLKNRGYLRLDQARDEWLHKVCVKNCG